MRNRNSSLEHCFRQQQSHEEKFNSMMLWDSLKTRVYQKSHILRIEAISWNIFGYPQEANKSGCLCLSTEAPWCTACNLQIMQVKVLNLNDWFGRAFHFHYALSYSYESGESNFTKCLVCLYPHVALEPHLSTDPITQRSKKVLFPYFFLKSKQ